MLKNFMMATLLFSSFSAFAKVDSLNVDPANSKLIYIGKKVTGEHTGEVKIANGRLDFEKGSLKGGEFEVDMTTISNTDIADKDYHKKFIDHMISEDFFSVEKFKTAKLVIKSVKKTKADNYSVTGELTIKGKTAPITFDAIATTEKASAKITFDRTTYDIKYGSGKFFQGLGDKMIHDNVQLDVNLIVKK